MSATEQSLMTEIPVDGRLCHAYIQELSSCLACSHRSSRNEILCCEGALVHRHSPLAL